METNVQEELCQDEMPNLVDRETPLHFTKCRKGQWGGASRAVVALLTDYFSHPVSGFD